MTRPTAPLPPEAQAPAQTAPDGAVDTHFHMLAAPAEFPLHDKRSENPATSLEDYLTRYRTMAAALGLSRGVVVQSIFYGTDNSVTVEAIRQLGPGYTGIGLLTDDATDATLDQFVAWGLKGVRLNYVHGGVLTWEGARHLAPRLAERGLHIQMLAHAHLHLEDIAPALADLACDVVFDHIAWPDLALGPEHPGFQALIRALRDGHARVKLSGLYRLCAAPYAAADSHVAALVAANPQACLWGTDWPFIMLNGARMPQPAALLDAFHRAVPDRATQAQILVTNPQRLYF